MSVNNVGVNSGILRQQIYYFLNCDDFETPKGNLGFSLLWEAIFSESWRLSWLQAGKKQGCLHGTEPSPLTQRLMPFRSSVFTISICCPRRIGSQLCRPLRKAICRIPLAFPKLSSPSIQMSAFSFHSIGFAKQKYDIVWNSLIKVGHIQNIQYMGNMGNQLPEEIIQPKYLEEFRRV